MFVKKALLTTTSVVYSISVVNNFNLFVMAGIDTWNYKMLQGCHKKDVPTFLFQPFAKKAGLEAVKCWN